MDIVKESYRLYELAWKPGADYDGYLQQALSLLQTAYEAGDHRNIIVNNYAAVLLDLQRNQDALDLLKQYQPGFSTYCSNYAIAIAKTTYRIIDIRKWNTDAKNYPALDYAIEAYIDWHGF